mmetsp:Transcript_12198/g.22170  ORF Transcript_12198/g.22170 Transcript_12198/m.22170 type:complete len:349 (-) Transcript_12198:308-1354(-)
MIIIILSSFSSITAFQLLKLVNGGWIVGNFFNHGTHRHFLEQESIVIVVSFKVIAKEVRIWKALTNDTSLSKSSQFLCIKVLLRRTNCPTTNLGLFRRQVGESQVQTRDTLHDSLETRLTYKLDLGEITLVVTTSHSDKLVFLDWLFLCSNSHDSRHVMNGNETHTVLHESTNVLNGLNDRRFTVALDINLALALCCNSRSNAQGLILSSIRNALVHNLKDKLLFLAVATGNHPQAGIRNGRNQTLLRHCRIVCITITIVCIGTTRIQVYSSSRHAMTVFNITCHVGNTRINKTIASRLSTTAILLTNKLFRFFVHLFPTNIFFCVMLFHNIMRIGILVVVFILVFIS